MKINITDQITDAITSKISNDWADLFAAEVNSQGAVLSNVAKLVVEREFPALDQFAVGRLTSLVIGSMEAGMAWQRDGRKAFFETPRGMEIYNNAMERLEKQSVASKEEL